VGYLRSAAAAAGDTALNQPPKEEVLATGRYLRLVKRGRWEYADRINAKGAAVIVAIDPKVYAGLYFAGRTS
jgi:hypothetical protein